MTGAQDTRTFRLTCRWRGAASAQECVRTAVVMRTEPAPETFAEMKYGQFEEATSLTKLSSCSPTFVPSSLTKLRE
jgi:hypothetical protein